VPHEPGKPAPAAPGEPPPPQLYKQPAAPKNENPERPYFGIKKDLVYHQLGERKLRLDLYLPREVERPLATVVYIHGGGWHMGKKVPCPVQPLLSDGFGVACVEYRLSAEAIFPAQLHDVRSAVKWLRENGSQYGLATETIGAWGLSAGGHLAAMLGMAGEVKELKQDPEDDPALHRIQAVAAWFPPTDLMAMKWEGYHEYADAARRLLGLKGIKQIHAHPMARIASPVTHVSKGDPPLLLMHGRLDRVVPVAQGRLLSEALNKAGVQAEFRELPEAGHGDGFKEAQEEEVRDFFRLHLRGGKPPRRIPRK